jgi:mono/diheme cytochrome c family protein
MLFRPFLALLPALIVSSAYAAGGLTVSLSPNADAAAEPLKTWSFDEIKALKQLSSRELDPASGKVAQWQGVSLDRLLEDAMAKLPADRRAQIDLVVLKGSEGAKTLVPRYFVKKFPMLVAFSRDKGALGAEGPLASVAPWTSKPNVTQESLPVTAYFVPKLESIELTNYRARFAPLFLKRRTDPAAMRGEKLFVQSCLSCHGAGKGPAFSDVSVAAASVEKARALASSEHPAIKEFPKLNDREKRALMSYLEALKAENPAR